MATKKPAALPAKQPATALLPGVSEDEQFIAAAGRAVLDFLKGLSGFFTTARALEDEALQIAKDAKLWVEPTNSDEDVALQEQIKHGNQVKKQIAEHWKITATVSQFHKRLTSRRDRGIDAVEGATLIGNRFHNSYVERANRRAAEQVERERKQAELDAQAKRDREQLELEMKAQEAEAASPDLSEREQRFVFAYCNGTGGDRGNAPRCARLCGYKNPDEAALRLIRSDKIKAAIAALESANAIRQQKAAAAQKPLEVETKTAIKPDVQRAAGAHDRTTHGAEVLDEQALIDAVLAGKHGIPTDVLMVNHSKVNTYGRDLHELVNRWPGVRYTKNTKVV
jgi:hypothetical protein